MVLVLQCFLSLFPAYAGVIPKAKKNHHQATTFPRIRGGDPIDAGFQQNMSNFSPHTRG